MTIEPVLCKRSIREVIFRKLIELMARFVRRCVSADRVLKFEIAYSCANRDCGMLLTESNI